MDEKTFDPRKVFPGFQLEKIGIKCGDISEKPINNKFRPEKKENFTCSICILEPRCKLAWDSCFDMNGECLLLK